MEDECGFIPKSTRKAIQLQVFKGLIWINSGGGSMHGFH